MTFEYWGIAESIGVLHDRNRQQARNFVDEFVSADELAEIRKSIDKKRKS